MAPKAWQVMRVLRVLWVLRVPWALWVLEDWQVPQEQWGQREKQALSV